VVRPDFEADRPPIGFQVEGRERQVERIVSGVRGCGDRRCESLVIEGAGARPPLRVDHHELRTLGDGIPVPEAAALQPVRPHAGPKDEWAGVLAQELLGPGIVICCEHALRRLLRGGWGGRDEHRDEQRTVSHTDPRLLGCGQTAEDG
jgi:hypothetical protein